MPPEYDERQVIKLLDKYGPIRSVQLARNLRSAKRLDFAFVIYEHHKDAVACVKGSFCSTSENIHIFYHFFNMLVDQTPMKRCKKLSSF